MQILIRAKYVLSVKFVAEFNHKAHKEKTQSSQSFAFIALASRTLRLIFYNYNLCLFFLKSGNNFLIIVKSGFGNGLPAEFLQYPFTTSFAHSFRQFGMI